MNWEFRIQNCELLLTFKKYLQWYKGPILQCNSYVHIPDKKRNALLRTIQLSGISQVIGQFSLYQCKGMSGTAALHVFCNQASKLC